MKARFLLLLLATCTLSFTSARAGDPAAALRGGGGTLITAIGSRQPCEGELLFHGDGGAGGYEDAYAWQYGGVQAPYYGAFADSFGIDVEICALFFDFTRRSGYDHPDDVDAYVWEEAGGQPGNVLAVVHALVEGVAAWPNFSRHFVELPENVSLPVWVGYWGDWPDELASWYVCADTDPDGPNAGAPMTNIAPGIGYPTGWQSVDLVWPLDRRTRALGLGAVIYGGPVPVDGPTWASIKSLFR
jgi:hypothetical protein